MCTLIHVVSLGLDNGRAQPHSLVHVDADDGLACALLAGTGAPNRSPARFATVAALCAHVDEWHPTAAGEPGMRGATVAETTTLASWNNPFTRAPGWGDGGGRPAADDVYRCHHCRAVFSDPVALLSHNETSCTSSGLTRDVPRASQRGHSNTRDCVIC